MNDAPINTRAGLGSARMGRWVDPHVLYVTWIRTVVPTVAGFLLLALTTWIDIDGLTTAALFTIFNGVVVAPLLLLAAHRFGFEPVARVSIYLDIVVVAIAIGQIDHIATFAVVFLWPVALAAMLLTPRETIVVGALAIVVSLVSPALRGYENEAVIAINGVVTLGIVAMISTLRVNEYRATAERRAIDRQLQAAQRIARLGSFVYDLASDDVTWSDEVYRIYGIEPGRPLSRYAFVEQVTATDRSRVGAILEHSIREREDSDFETRIIRGDGGVRHVRVSGRHVTEGGRQRVVGTIQDITELRRLDELRDEFVAAASHELRTPTSIVLGFAATLANRWDELAEADRRSFVGEIDSAARRLSMLVEDVLQASQIESGRVRCDAEPFDLVAEVRDFVRTWPGGVPVEVELSGDGIVPVVGDRARSRQVLGNLLENAARHTPPAEMIVVRLAREDAFVAAHVIDRGPGIPVVDQRRIFDRFVRLDHDSVGTGLGLYISRRLADAQGGQLTVDSAPGRGATFTYALPVDPGRVGA